MNPAFVFVDLLEDFFAKAPLSERRSSIVGAVNDLAGYAREHSFPVVWVRQEFEPDLSDAFLSMKDAGISITVRGTGGSELLAGIRAEPGDHDVIKKRYSAFFGTRLQPLLSSLGCTHIVMGGVNSHACVR
jgi:nicotinamidase-related amidase